MFNDEKQQEEARKPWPINSPWPEPTDNGMNYDEDLIPNNYDGKIEYLIKIKEYYDSLVDSERLNDDYTLNDGNKEWCDKDEEEFTPEIGDEYWDNGFDIESWREDLSNHINLLQLPPMDPYKNPIIAMRSAFSYRFTNENLPVRSSFSRFGRFFPLMQPQEMVCPFFR